MDQSLGARFFHNFIYSAFVSTQFHKNCLKSFSFNPLQYSFLKINSIFFLKKVWKVDSTSSKNLLNEGVLRREMRAVGPAEKLDSVCRRMMRSREALYRPGSCAFQYQQFRRSTRPRAWWRI